MKLNPFVRRVIEADADYFLQSGHISGVQYARVKLWLYNGEDLEAQHLVAGWLLRDAEYIEKLQGAASRLVWYFGPLTWLACLAFRNIIGKYANKYANRRLK